MNRPPAFVRILEDGSRELYCSPACRGSLPAAGMIEHVTEPMPFAARPAIGARCHACSDII